MTLIPSAGLRSQLPHLAAYLLFFVLLLVSPASTVEAFASPSGLDPRLLLLMASPWVLGVLILVFERQSQMKSWAAPLLLSLLAPALVILNNWQAAQRSPVTPHHPILIAMLLINVSLVAGFTANLRKRCPRRCPECHDWAMSPLRNFPGSNERVRNTLWCASCGALYWQTVQGEWKKERRRTWLDLPTRDAAPKLATAEPAFDTSSRIIAPVVRSSGKAKRAPSGDSSEGGTSSEMAVLREGDASGRHR